MREVSDLGLPPSSEWRDWKCKRIWGIILLLIVVSIVALVYGSQLYLVFLDIGSQGPNVVSSIAAAASALFAFVALIFATFQLRGVTRRSHLIATLDVVNRLGSEEARAARYYVLNKLPKLKDKLGELEIDPETDPEKWPEKAKNKWLKWKKGDQYKKAWSVWKELNHVGTSVYFGLAWERPVLELLHVVTRQLWNEKLEDYIKVERKVHSERSRYMEYFEYLAIRSEDWYKKYTE